MSVITTSWDIKPEIVHGKTMFHARVEIVNAGPLDTKDLLKVRTYSDVGTSYKYCPTCERYLYTYKKAKKWVEKQLYGAAKIARKYLKTYAVSPPAGSVRSIYIEPGVEC